MGDMLNLYLADIKASMPMRERFRFYFLKAKELMRHSYYTEVLEQLSPGLRGELAMHCHSGWLSQIPFFNCGDELERQQFMVAVAMNLKRKAFTKMEMVCRQGDQADAMYIIMSGLVGCGGRVRRAGNFFGVDMIQENGVVVNTANAVTFVDCQCLLRDNLLQLLNHGDFPETQKLVRKAAFRMCLSNFVKLIGREARKKLEKKKGLEMKETRADLAQWKAKIKRKRILAKSNTTKTREENYDPSSVDHDDLTQRLMAHAGVSFSDSHNHDDTDIEYKLRSLEKRLTQRMNVQFEELEEKIDLLLDRVSDCRVPPR